MLQTYTFLRMCDRMDIFNGNHQSIYFQSNRSLPFVNPLNIVKLMENPINVIGIR